MGELFNKNLGLIRQRWPHLTESFLSDGEGENFLARLQCKVVPSRLSGKPSLKIDTGERELSVHSLYDPEGEARRWAQGLDLEGIRFLGVFGLGLGYHIGELVRTWPNLERIVVIEPSHEILKAACKAVDLEKLLDLEKIDLVVIGDGLEEKDRAGVKKAEQYLGQHLAPLFQTGQLDAVQFVEFGPYPRLFPEHYRLLRTVCANLGRAVRINENTILFFSQMWPQNIFANLVDTVTSPGVINLFGKFEGWPGIVISAGPSLNKNLYLLREAKGRAVLLCVGTALRALLKEGILPDLVVTLDGAEANYRHFASLAAEEVPLVFVPTAHYRILEEYQGLKFVVGGGNPLIDWICQFTEPKGLLNFGGSVAHATFDLALRMGCEPVILVGQDLAYTGGATHARGTVYEGKTVQEGKDKFYVEDVFGGLVLTDHVLNEFRLWFEKAISTFARGRLVIDATEGGAKIAGTVIMPLREALERYCREQFPVTEIVASAAAVPVPVAEAGERLLVALEEALVNIEKLEKLARKGAGLARTLDLEYRKNRPDSGAVQKVLRRMDKIDRELQSSEANAFLNLILQPVLLAVTKGSLARAEEGETERELAHRVAARSALLYEGVAEASQKMRGFMAKARDALSARLQEGH